MHSRPRHPFGIPLLVSLLAILGLALPGLAAADKPRIVATILPIHSIVAALGEDAFEVELLVPASASPHGYSMRPSEARRLQNADMVVWVGPELETFLERPLRRAGDREIISLMDDLDLDLKPTREGGVWEHHHDHGNDGHGHGDHDHDHNGHGHATTTTGIRKTIMAITTRPMDTSTITIMATTMPTSGSRRRLCARSPSSSPNG